MFQQFNPSFSDNDPSINLYTIPGVELPTTTVFKMPLGFNPFAVKVNPFDGQILAIAACQNFGLKGIGRLFIIKLTSNFSSELLDQFDFKDGLFDLAWSEIEANVLITGGGDGKVYRIDLRTKQCVELYGHGKEISSLDCCPLRTDKFLSTSWDGTIQLSTGTIFRGHNAVVNEARWNPRTPNLLVSVSADRTVRLWDDRPASRPDVLIVPPLGADYLSVDWNKYEEWAVVSATSTDLLFWDLRSVGKGPTFRIPNAHRRAIKRVRYSPWQANKLASVGFDMALRSWDTASLNPRGCIFEQYTEFVTGLDWSNFEKNLIFTSSWDETIRATNLI